MTFNNYLSQFTKNTETKQTHLSFNRGKFNVPDSEHNKFYKNYFEFVVKNGEESFLIEKVYNSKFAFFLDIEPKLKSEIVLTTSDIKKIIESTNSCISKIFSNPSTDYIVSKRENNYHINYTNLIVNSSIANLLYLNIIEELPIELKHVIDSSVYRTGLRLLGSKKKTLKNQKNEIQYYQIFDISSETLTELTNTSYEDFLKTIVRKTENTKLSEVNDEFKGSSSNNHKHHDIQVKGITSKEVVLDIKKLLEHLKETNECLQNFNLNISRIYAAQNKMGLFCYYISISEKFCPFKERHHKRDSSPLYVEINPTGIFVKCYDQDCLRRRYPENGILFPENFEKDYYDLHQSMTTRYWRSEVQLTNDIKMYLEDSLCCSHFKIAKAAFEIYKNRFRVDDIKNTEWYEFDGFRWKKSHIMNILISEELPKYFKAIKISDTSMSNSDDLKQFLVNQEQIDANIRNQLIDSIISKLENVNFKNSILQQLTYLFKNHDPDFCSKLDSNPHLLGFKNGVYNLQTNIFSNHGKVDDYITFSTGYDYISYDENDETVQDIYKFLSQIIPNKKVLEYTLKVLGTSLVGIPDEKFYIWTGLSGANGKSTLINFLETTLGDYIASADVSLLTNKRNNSSNASPDVIRLKGKRIFAFQEPEHDDRLRTGILKQFTGGDTIIARELFKAPVSFKLQGTMIMCCNDLPVVNSDDGGTWRRIRVVEFKSRFCDHPLKENEFKIDPSIKYKIHQWKPYFMSILLHNLQIFQKKGLDEPEEVKRATNKYKIENDKFNEFFDNYIEERPEYFETNKNLYSQFSNWWCINYPNTKLPDFKDFRRACKIKYGNEKDQVISGIKQLGFSLKFKQQFFEENFEQVSND